MFLVRLLALLLASQLLLADAVALTTKTDLDAITVHRKDSVIGASTPKRALVILAGLMRHFELSWPGIVRDLIEPNEQDGYQFSIVVATSLGAKCLPNGTLWHKRKCEDVDSNETDAEHEDRIRNIIAPRIVDIVDNRSVCPMPKFVLEHKAMVQRRAEEAEKRKPTLARDRDYDRGRTIDIDMTVEDADTADELEGFLCNNFMNRVGEVLAMYEGKVFDRVIALRPDVRLIDSSSGAAKTMRFDEVCAASPGFNIISHDVEITRPRVFFHNRDMDFIQLLCAGGDRSLYRDALADWGACKCKHKQTVAPLPPGFISTHGWSCGAVMCNFVATFDGKLPLRNLDDQYFASWVKLPRKR